MTRLLAPYVPAKHGKISMGGEPLVFHCNFYNYFLQKTLLLDDSLGMETVIHDAALSSAFALLTRAGREAGLDTADSRQRLAQDTFAQLGFGLLDLSGVGPTGGQARTPMSHYGKMLRMASGADFAGPQSYFDAGYAAAAAAFVHGRPVETFSGVIRACQALGADVGLHDIVEQAPKVLYRSPGVGSHREDAPCERDAETSVDEPAILAALAGLDFAGNEEGLVPRFGVVLTHHFANFYNRISFEFVRRMQDSGMLEAAEDLLREAGLRCAFHTFGGIMSSPEWDAVVRPQCRTQIDWVHGMTAVVNALGWGTWRVRSVSSDRLVMRIYDDYESSGYEGMYGQSDRPISYLAEGAVAGLMNLVFVGNIHEKPVLDYDFYARVFESPQRFSSTVNSCMARGEGYTEITASR